MKTSKISLYIHWPYCLSKCPYCDFSSRVCSHIDEEILWRGYQRDLELFLTDRPVQTIFFGGGTPSLMSVAFADKIINTVAKKAIICSDAEITMEANPDAIDLEKMKAFHAVGINRLSLGVQSLNDSDLDFLGRKHTSQTALQRIKEAQSVFNRINIDLIYARPNQTATQWEAELKQALSLGLTHYSLYQLTIEEKTVFGRKKISPVPDEVAADLYRLTDKIMNNAKIPAYEVSNYAAPGQECRHNLTYWHGDDYIGIGPAAHGRIGMTASQNPTDISKWLNNGPHTEKLTSAEKMTEKLLMGLRLRQEWFDASDLNQKIIQKLSRQGLLEQNGSLIRPTVNGTLVLDRVILELMPS